MAYLAADKELQKGPMFEEVTTFRASKAQPFNPGIKADKV